jgi:hypothetical protein
MLPYPTDRRRLLMMVRVFLHEFSEWVQANRDGSPYPSDVADDCADHQLERFLERLAVDADQLDEAAVRPETEIEVYRCLEQHLCELLRHAASTHDRLRWN